MSPLVWIGFTATRRLWNTGRYGQTEVWPQERTKASAEGFHGALEGWERLLEIAGDHDRFTFNARV
jgi:hypothetical protein